MNGELAVLLWFTRPCVSGRTQGVLNATKSVATILSLAAGQGAVLRDNHKVTNVDYAAKDEKGDPIVVVTSNRGQVPTGLVITVDAFVWVPRVV